MTDKNIPLIRLSFFEPFVEELKSNGVDASAIFHSVGLDIAEIENHSSFIPADTMYQLADKAAAKLKNPYLASKKSVNYDLLRFCHLLNLLKEW